MTMPLAAQSTWTATTNANWSTATNWNPGIPANGDNIIIADTTPGNALTLDDASHSVGSITIGNTGTRTAAFNFQTNAANTLTIAGGLTANGNFTAGIGTRLRGNYLISAVQNWQIGGEAGSHALDRGVAFNEISAGNLGSVTLNANLNKSGTGQLTFGATAVSGAGDLNINEGSLKLNAGGSMQLSIGGTGKITANNSATLILSKNSGTFNVTRPIQFNNTAKLETGSGSTNQAGTYEIASNVEWTGIHTVTNNANGGNVNYQFTGVMSGSGSITKSGPSQLIFAGSSANTLSGQVAVAAGELMLDKTEGVTAVPGNILVSGGTLRINKAHQIADTSGITVTSGLIAFTVDRPETIASLNISSGTASSLSGLNVTGATSISAGIQELNSGQTFTTHSLALSNNAAIRPVGNATAPASSTINVGAGGLALNTGRLIFGNAGNTTPIQLNLGGDLVSTGTSLISATNYSGPRIIDLQASSRAFAVNDGTLDIRTNVQNGTLVKSGAGKLILSNPGSTANLSATEGPVQIVSQVDAANLSLSGSSLLMDLGGATPAKLVASGDVTTTGSTIEISGANGPVGAGVFEVLRYNGTLTGTPTVNIPAALVASRMNPVIDYGTGTNSAVTVTSAAAPLGLVWRGTSGSAWDYNGTANFNGGEKFFSLDSVTFDDTGVGSSVQVNSAVFPADVVFNHGATVPFYTVSGTGSISGETKLTKSGTGITILATDNNYTGATDVLGGTLQIGNGGLTGSLGSGAVFVDAGTTLRFVRSGTAVVGNLITGTGSIVNSGSGTAAFTANSTGFTGTVSVTGGTLQFGDGGADGSLGTMPVEISSGATFAVKRSGSPVISNTLSGAGSLAVIGGAPNITGFNTHTGGVTVTGDGVLRAPSDSAFGNLPMNPTPNAIRLNNGGLKNLESYTSIDSYRGITISGEAYFTAGWTNTLSILGPITGTGNVFINYDSGRVIFNDPTSDWNGVLTLGANKPGFTGTTGGNLEISAITNGGVAGPIGKASADPSNIVFNGGRLIYSGDFAATNRGFTLESTGTIEVPFSTLAIAGKATGPGSLTKAGAGTLILSGTSDFAGTKTIAAGTLVAKTANALGDPAASVRFTGTTGVLELATNATIAPYSVDIGVGNSGTVRSGVATPGAGINHTLGGLSLSTVTLNVDASADVSGGSPRVSFGSLSLSGGSAGTTTLNPTTADITLGSASIGAGNYAKTLALGGTSQNNLLTGTIADGLNILSLRKINDSLWTVSGDNAFSGNVVVDDGVLAITHGNALGAPTKDLSIAGDANTNRLPELRVSGGIAPTVAVLNISGAGIANTGALRNISGDNTLTATTRVNMTTGNGNTTLYSDAGTLTLNSPLVTATASNRTLNLAGPGNGVINGVIANGTTASLPIVKTGTGTWTLNGAHTYTGTTTINEGVLSLGQAALSDSAAVTIATGAKLNLNFSGTDRVGSLTINGVTKADGVYSATTDPGFITGSGSIRVGAGPDGYSNWASAYPFQSGVNDGAEQDADGDGIKNLLEYVLGGVPAGAGASNTSILPVQALTSTDVTLTFKRSDVSEADVALKVQWSSNATTWNDFATIGPVSSLPAVNVTEDSPIAAVDTVVVTIPRSNAVNGKLFVRLVAAK